MENKITPFHLAEEAEQSFGFRKPTMAELDLCITRMAKAPITAATQFTKTLILEEYRAAWQTLTNDQPLLAITISSEILGKLGLKTN